MLEALKTRNVVIIIKGKLLFLQLRLLIEHPGKSFWSLYINKVDDVISPVPRHVQWCKGLLMTDDGEWISMDPKMIDGWFL